MKKSSKLYKNNSWFTLIELMVAILIFTIWILSAYLLVYNAINSSTYSKNEIIWANIAREQIELIKNIRDTNWLKFYKWDKIDNSLSTWSWSFSDLTYFTIENNYSNKDFPIKINKLDSNFTPEKVEIINNPRLQLCLDDKNRYIHCNWASSKIPFYSFVKITPLYTKKNNIDLKVDDAYKIESVVASTERWYREYRINSIITNWKKE